MIPLRASIGVAAAIGLLVGLARCNDPVGHRCTNIPPGGCPGQGSADCVDPSCAAVYTCEPDGTWLFDQPCPAQDGGPEAAAPPADASAPDTSYIDAPPGAFGGPGCSDLQTPDCSLGVALTCAASSCCDCQDLFVCQAGSWVLWGQCVDGGITQGD
jgi:hypothetical protein